MITISSGASLFLQQGITFAHEVNEEVLERAAIWLSDFVPFFYGRSGFPLLQSSTPDRSIRSQRALEASLIYLICHELAHIYLGHIVSWKDLERYTLLKTGDGLVPRRSQLRDSFHTDEIEADAKACSVSFPVIEHFCLEKGIEDIEAIDRTKAAIDILYSLLNLTLQPLCKPEPFHVREAIDMLVNRLDYPCPFIRRTHFRDYFLPRLGHMAQLYATGISDLLELLSEGMLRWEFPPSHPISRLREEFRVMADDPS